MISQPPDFADVAALSKALGDALRLQILRILVQDAYGVFELCQIFDCRQSGMSHHLKVLAAVGLVVRRREGNSIFYSRSSSLHGGMISAGQVLIQQQFFDVIDGFEVPEEIQHRVEAVKRGRAERSRVFFEQHAHRFSEQQDLIADYPTYGEVVVEMLAITIMPSKQLAIEVGPGQGELLPVLSRQFARVIALDNSLSLLEKARGFCRQQSSRQSLLREKPETDNIDFVCADTGCLRQKPTADCVVMNMVLHHTSSPADIFRDLAQFMKPDGALLLTELCRHDQDWVKSSCGDVWLGFDPEELYYWATLAGLTVGHSHYFALRNGFQVQLQQFRKCGTPDSEAGTAIQNKNPGESCSGT